MLLLFAYLLISGVDEICVTSGMRRSHHVSLWIKAAIVSVLQSMLRKVTGVGSRILHQGATRTQTRW